MLKKQTANFITGLNLISGCIGITFTFSGDLHIASYFIIISAILDFFDGFVSRLLKTNSRFGKEFDSLADIISFGFLPASIIYVYMSNSFFCCIDANQYIELLSYSAFIIVIFSAIRLAKFNTDKTQNSSSFTGLPTPANALLIASIPIIIKSGNFDSSLFKLIYYISNSFLHLLIFTIISSMLLTSGLRMIALKFESYGFKKNFLKYILIIFAIITLIIYNLSAIPLIIIFYIFLSIINNFKIKKDIKN